MTNAKVTLPREVVEAIELSKSQGDVERMVAIVAEKDPIGYERFATIMRLDLFTLMKALVNGYEVEKSPEEKVREYYNAKGSKRRFADQYDRGYAYGILEGIERTLDLLGIEIGGDND
ncbi:hypothetical protein I2483_13905 [Sporosarcina sp. E16_3]|uniref:hypothetical protein n=1 Tax=Sporosarcina sp. E16_3 TaxID=2789293 RepID=UPI001A92CD38|nr:hypothetical protein [Sporosarcina sp. E16_3]MBO0602758.1 hypothetical protein [Sporosarcina sp. E16_3]